VARRVLFLFTVGAALPVAVLSVLSFTAISGQLRQQGEVGLSQFANVATQSIIERLVGFRTLLESAAAIAGPGTSAPDELPLPPGVEGIAVATEDRLVPVAGSVGAIGALSPDNAARLAEGGAVLQLDRGEGGVGVRALMGVPVRVGAVPEAVLWARIIGDSIWAPAVTQSSDPSVGSLCILDSAALPLSCPAGLAASITELIGPPSGRQVNSGRLELDGPEGPLLMAWRDVYLRPAFNAPSWTVAVSQPVTSVYRGVETFIYNLMLVILVGVSSVLLLTHVMVRRTMEPLEELTEGTRRIARHDLDVRVDVRSDDEFGDLASSFNEMAERLGLQFRQLEAGRAIDHTAIAAEDHTQAVRALLEGMGDVVSSGRRAVLLSEVGSPDTASLFSLDGALDPMNRSVHVGGAAEAARALGRRESRVIERLDDVPEVLRAWAGDGADGAGRSILLLPLKVRQEALGVMAVESDSERGFVAADSRRAQQLVDQAAVALAKMKLDKDLAAMSWEVLRALANAIDAKSPWTTGHSERVTGLALMLGRDLRLSTEDMNTLHRGGLLHDVGKIGVPASVLDLEGPLDAESRALIEAHPAAGARILEPIRAFGPLLPIVLYHHERWDGAGYPEGLAGTDIPRLARLLAVADVFDAMVSARPYRPALSATQVLQHIRDSAGSHFDPEMVEALVRVMEAGWTPQHTRVGDPVNA
jgi:HD-GYP domain-containing protein (c-di-GMP phosphodiesterase class II)/HAMP domain-containing protein